MMMAPVVSLMTGWTPVEAYSFTFFAHILPVLITSELAMTVGCKGYNINVGRMVAVGALTIHARAFWQVARGQKPKFPATPKTPVFSDFQAKRMLPNLVLLLAMAVAGLYGSIAAFLGVAGCSASFLTVNLFWLSWNALSLVRVAGIAFWRPDEGRSQLPRKGKDETRRTGKLSNVSI